MPTSGGYDTSLLTKEVMSCLSTPQGRCNRTEQIIRRIKPNFIVVVKDSSLGLTVVITMKRQKRIHVDNQNVSKLNLCGFVSR